MALVFPSVSVSFPKVPGKWKNWRYVDFSNKERTFPRVATICASTSSKSKKIVWIWTENKHVMTAAVERGWNTFIFSSHRQDLALEWSFLYFHFYTIALIYPLFIEEGRLIDHDNQRVAAFAEISSPQQLEQFQISEELADKVVVNLLDWQALEHGLGGVVMKVEDFGAVLVLKGYFDRRREVDSLLNLTKAKITHVQTTGMGDRVCVDICSLMKPGEGLLVGSFARGLFLVHSECLESDYISSRPFRVNAGPVHAYVAVPGGKTSYLSELKSGKEVIVVNQRGMQRTAIVGRVKVETRPLILVEAKVQHLQHARCNMWNPQSYSILMQNAETVGLVSLLHGEEHQQTAIPVTSLRVGDEVLLLVQGGTRHTGIEIEEFIIEK
ncbi:hypothetical protein CQW23_09953 [Capsicum baccatum]|uniref:3-dehydroquinate synthase n=1 Tax=Capsicum baccatum TaxID=33114 RepID=A0A2G2WY67_CAPBA|nr:hypothetical protein CQW23_09953 [Capsicum baccatum]